MDAAAADAGRVDAAEEAPAPDPWEEELRREIDRLRGEIAELRESKSALLRNLRDAERSRSLDAEEALKSWGTTLGPGPVSVEPLSSALPDFLAEAGPSDVPVDRPPGQRVPAPGATLIPPPRSAAASAAGLQSNGRRLHPKGSSETARPGFSAPTIDRTLAGVAAVTLGIAVGLAGGALMGTGPDLRQGDGQMVAAGFNEKVVSVRHMSRSEKAEKKEQARANQAEAAADEASQAKATEAPRGQPSEGLSAMKSQAIAASAPKLGAVGFSSNSTAEPATASADGTPGQVAADTATEETNPAWELPLYLADIAPSAFKVRRSTASTPCAFAERLMDPERRDELLPALGPCIGAHGQGGSPVGTHRVAGVDCCAHHAFVERMTQASRNADAMAGILAEAKVAKRDGEVPPLLRLRAERSALQFLRKLAGTWASAGIDDGSLGHRWTSSNSDPTRMRLSSWIRLEETGDSHSFEMEIELSDGPRGDLLVAFDWSATDPLGVIIRERDSADSSK